MTPYFSKSFRHDYHKLSHEIQQATDEAVNLLLSNPRYPSLRSKKLPNSHVWYARVNRAYRFTFQIDGDTITLRRVGTHEILGKER